MVKAMRTYHALIKGTHKEDLSSSTRKKKKLPTVPTMRALRLIFTLIQFGMFHECLMNNFRTLNVNENQREIFLTLLIKIETHVERVAPQNA